MRRPAVSRGIESALERAVELPFLRRTTINLPLLQRALRRAMEDEVKPIVPTRYTLTIPSEHLARVGQDREEWERELRQYFLDLLQTNRWSAMGEPHVIIAYDPSLRGDRVQVAVEEPELVHNGGTVRPGLRRHRSSGIVVLAVVLILCAALLAAVMQPELGTGLKSIRVPGIPTSQVTPPWSALQRQVASWWDNIDSSILSRFPGEKTAEVVATPCLVVRAGAPGSDSATRPESCIPRGTVLRWWPDQVVTGQSIQNEDRWIRIGTAGPDWGDHAGQPLYVWMGGLRER